MDIHRVYRPFLKHFRKARIALLYELFDIDAHTRVLDVGGSGEFWSVAESCGFPRPRVTVVNLYPPRGEERRFSWIIADGARLPFRDNEFDLAISNSVIEHVSAFDVQLGFGREVLRSARNAFVQTPDFWCLIEPHFLAPAVHWMPPGLRAKVLPLTPWGLITKPSQQYVKRVVEEIRLLTRAEVVRIFPDCVIIRERFCGLPKDLVAVRRVPGASPTASA